MAAAAPEDNGSPDDEGSTLGSGEVTCGRFVYSWMESMSTEKTRAPSLASRAASGLPTTSDLNILIRNHIIDDTTSLADLLQ
jgi:hypothetical protein